MILTIVADIFWFVVTFSILVVLHEGGHFLVARAFGVHVSEFMIGLPGPSLRFHGKKTDYGITAVPLGGYVRISGMEPGPEDPRLDNALAYITRRRRATIDELAADLGLDLDSADMLATTLVDWNAIKPADDAEETFVANEPAELADDPARLLDRARSTTFRGLSPLKRIAVLSAGVVVNLVSAVLVFVLVLTLVGTAQPTLSVQSTVAGGGARAAGLRAGDTLTSFGGQHLSDWNALLAAIAKHKPGDIVAVTFVRNGQDQTAQVTLGSQPPNRTAFLGIQIQSKNVPMPIGQAFTVSFGFIGLVFKAISGFFSPATFQTSISQSTGVIGVAVIANQEAQRGPIDFAFFIALLSVSLGAMNILPIPPLDGGKVAIEIVELVSRRQLSRKLTIGISLAGTALLVTLIGYLMYADVVRYIIKG